MYDRFDGVAQRVQFRKVVNLQMNVLNEKSGPKSQLLEVDFGLLILERRLLQIFMQSSVFEICSDSSKRKQRRN